jgi:ABC-2 type transport system permease protein
MANYVQKNRTMSIRTVEFSMVKQIFRDLNMLRMIIVIPMVQLLILPQAADYEIKNISLTLVDSDHSEYSRKLIEKISASGYFIIQVEKASFGEAFETIENDLADLILEIPANFEKNLVKEQAESVFLALNAINGVKANVGGSYLGKIIADYNQEIRQEWIPEARISPYPQIEITTMNRFNPNMNYNFFMVPGILVFLVTMIGTYMTSLNIVKEKEVGTIEQINVTPIKKIEFILGKLIPFWIIGVFIFTLGLFFIARIVYGIVPVGNIGILYAYLFIYLIAILGVGLLISTYANTQQQAMSLAFFFVMIFLLMSGLFTSIDAMPIWAKVIASINPVTYFIEVMRLVVMKGSGISDLWVHFIVMTVFAIIINVWAVMNYKKTS